MRALRSIVAGFWILLFALVAASPAPAQRLDNALPSSWNIGSQIGPHGYAPVAQADFTTTSTLPSWLTLSVAGLATMTDSSGHLTYRPNNLLTYSNTFDNAAWVKTSATVTSGVRDPLGGTKAFTITATSANGYIQQVLTDASAASKKAIISIWLRRNAGSGAVKIYNPSAVSATTVALTSSWQQFYLVGYGNADGHFYATPVYITTSGDAVDVYASTLSAVTYETTPRAADQVITTSAAYYGPRFTYNPATGAAKGLLIEGSATNLLPYSTNFSSGWATGNVTRSTDTILASDGATLSAKYTANTTTGAHQWYNSVAVAITAGANYAISLETDGSSAAYPYLNFAVDGTHWISAVFDITTGADGSATQTGSSGGTVTSTNQKYLGNGRYRLTIVGSLTSAGAGAYVQPGLTNATTGNTFLGWGTISVTFAGTEYVYGSFAQLESGSFATSYIPTTTAAVTRAAESYQFGGAALTALIGMQASTIVDYQATSASTGVGRLIYLTVPTQSLIHQNDTSASLYDSATVTSLVATLGSSGTWSAGSRVAASWSASGRSIVGNGGVVATDSVNGVGGTGSYFGSADGGSSFAPGWYSGLAIYNSRLSDTVLQAKSVVGAPY